MDKFHIRLSKEKEKMQITSIRIEKGTLSQILPSFKE